MPVCTELLLTMDGGNPDYTLPLDMHTCYLESISGWCAHNCWTLAAEEAAAAVH